MRIRQLTETESDKVEAQIKFGWEVDAYPVNEIAESVAAVSQSDTNALVDEYYDKYDILLEGRDPEEFKKHVAVRAQIELGFERFLEEKNYQAIVTHFGDLGDRFRLIINTVDCKKTEKPMQKLPVATNFWTPQPDLYTGAEAWILAGGAHHTAFTYDLTAEQMGEWAAMMGIEAVFIDNDTTIRNFKKDLMLGNIFYK